MPKIKYVEHSGFEHVVEVSNGLTVMEGARDRPVNLWKKICLILLTNRIRKDLDSLAS